MWRSLSYLLRGLLIAYLAYLGALYFMQRDFIYYPMPDEADTTAQAYALQAAPGITLRGWVVNPGRDHALLYFGGNAERVSHSIGVAEKHFAEHSVYLVHYRGYGDSDGEPGEAALLGDALALYDDLARRHERISVIGRSLGSAMAVHVAARRPVASSVLITPFDSIQHIAAEHYPLVPVSWLLKDKFESWKSAAAIDSKVLVLIAENDFVVPRQHTDNLLRHFKPGVARAIELPGTDHISISHHPDYYPQIAAFVGRDQ